MGDLMSRVRFWFEHRWVPGRLSAHLDGDLSRRARRRVERHVGECGECRRLVGELRRTIEALHRLPTPDGGAGGPQIAGAVRVRLSELPGSGT